MNEWLKIAENLAHKRAGVVLSTIAAITFGGLDLSTNIVIMAGAVIYTACQTLSEKKEK